MSMLQCCHYNVSFGKFQTKTIFLFIICPFGMLNCWDVVWFKNEIDNGYKFERKRMKEYIIN